METTFDCKRNWPDSSPNTSTLGSGSIAPVIELVTKVMTNLKVLNYQITHARLEWKLFSLLYQWLDSHLANWQGKFACFHLLSLSDTALGRSPSHSLFLKVFVHGRMVCGYCPTLCFWSLNRCLFRLDFWLWNCAHVREKIIQSVVRIFAYCHIL